MQTVVALLLFALLAGAAWWVYLRTGARRWTTEHDPLGEPPVRMAALIGAIVIGVAFASSGGGGDHTNSMQQGMGDGDDPSLLSTPGTMVVAPATESAALQGEGPKSDAPETDTGGASPLQSAAQALPSPLPAYGRLVVRARKAAERRGATITWYPTVVHRAERASRQRGR